MKNNNTPFNKPTLKRGISLTQKIKDSKRRGIQRLREKLTGSRENQDIDFDLEVKQFLERMHDVETFIRQTSEVIDSYKTFSNTNQDLTTKISTTSVTIADRNSATLSSADRLKSVTLNQVSTGMMLLFQTSEQESLNMMNLIFEKRVSRPLRNILQNRYLALLIKIEDRKGILLDLNAHLHRVHCIEKEMIANIKKNDRQVKKLNKFQVKVEIDEIKLNESSTYILKEFRSIKSETSKLTSDALMSIVGIQQKVMKDTADAINDIFISGGSAASNSLLIEISNDIMNYKQLEKHDSDSNADLCGVRIVPDGARVEELDKYMKSVAHSTEEILVSLFSSTDTTTLVVTPDSVSKRNDDKEDGTSNAITVEEEAMLNTIENLKATFEPLLSVVVNNEEVVCDANTIQNHIHVEENKSTTPFASPTHSPELKHRGVDIDKIVIVAKSFKATRPGEMSVQAGDIVVLQGEIGDKWGMGISHGKTGRFPLNHTTVPTMI